MGQRRRGQPGGCGTVPDGEALIEFIPAPGSRAAIEKALDILGAKASDFGLVYNPTLGSYEYKGEVANERENLIRQGGTPIGYFDGENAVMDAAFIGCDTGRRLVREGRAVRWQNGLAEKLRNLEQNVPSVRRVRVYQLKPDVDPARKFIGYQELKELSGGPALKEYREVFCGQLDTDNPDELYERFNAAKLPKGYRGHRLSISDLLELIGEDTSEFWYLDLNGFIPVKFDKEESEE